MLAIPGGAGRLRLSAILSKRPKDAGTERNILCRVFRRQETKPQVVNLSKLKTRTK
jgi:hypothetical protein